MKHSALQLAAHLCRALRQRDEAMVAVLLQEGANPNLVLLEGVAAMHLAAGLEQEDGIRQHLLRLLLQHGGDPNVRSAEGLTPLHVAASWGRSTCLRLLLAEGGDPHLEDQDGSTAIDLAVEQGYERCVSILQDEKWNDGFSYSPELTSSLETYRIPNSRADEMALAAEFDRPDKSRRWREGLLKSSFNYLLLDPRVTQNLPARCQLLSSSECFRTFIQAIFYVGKGTRGRPYRHLYEALTHHREGQGAPARQVCLKVQHILEIWAGGQGVVSMHCFQNVVPVEAYTREACMVEAIGLKTLTNQKKGNYYGLVAGWPMKRRRNLGVFLLHRALQIFLGEGERQLRPADI